MSEWLGGVSYLMSSLSYSSDLGLSVREGAFLRVEWGRVGSLSMEFYGICFVCQVVT